MPPIIRLSLGIATAIGVALLVATIYFVYLFGG